MKELVEINNWSRFQPYSFFSKYSNPYGSVTTSVDADKIVRFAKDNNISFYALMSYVVLKTINELEAYKYVLENGNVYKYDQMNLSFTVLKKDNNINFSRIILFDELVPFINNFTLAKEEAELDVPIQYAHDMNVVYATCLPWIRFTSVQNPTNNIDSNPRVCWGKYFLNEDSYNIDVSIQFNHAFIDGFHVGQFFNLLQENISEFKVKDEEYCLLRSR